MKLDVIYNEDCIGKKGMCILPDKSIDMILCDLPYGTTACKWDTIIPFEPLWKEYKRIIKDNGAIALFGSEPFSSCLRLSNIKQYKYDWIWNKIAGSNFLNLKNRPLKTHEQILIFAPTANFTFNPIRVFRSEKSLKKDPIGIATTRICSKRKIEHYSCQWNGIRYSASDGMKHPIDIITFTRQEKDYLKIKHPTKKPVALLEYLIKTYTNEADIVLDNCMGSGTTAIACKKLNRRYIGYETSKKYYQIAKARLEAEKTLWDKKEK